MRIHRRVRRSVAFLCQSLLLLLCVAIISLSTISYWRVECLILHIPRTCLLGLLWSDGEVVVSYKSWQLNYPYNSSYGGLPFRFNRAALRDSLEIPWLRTALTPPESTWSIVARHNFVNGRPGRRTKWNIFGYVYELRLIGFPDGKAIIDTRRLLIPRIGLLLIACAAGTPSAIVLWLYRRHRRRHANRLCIVCGYDLRVSLARCPECGAIAP
jgi:hypothetical protein